MAKSVDFIIITIDSLFAQVVFPGFNLCFPPSGVDLSPASLGSLIPLMANPCRIKFSIDKETADKIAAFLDKFPEEEVKLREDGRLEFHNVQTGEVLVQAESVENVKRIEEGKLPIYQFDYKKFMHRKNSNGVALYVPSPLSKKDVLALPDDWHYLKDRDEDRSELLHRLSEGESLKKICGDPNMPPYSAVFDGMMKDPEFRDQIEFARKVVAERQKERLEELLDQIYDDDSAKVAKAKSEILKYLMGVNDKERFGNQKVVQEGGGNITFIVNTGIQRIESQDAIPAEGRVVAEEAADHINGILTPPTPERDPSEPQEI